MIFPRYSLRWLLALIVACAFFFLCFSLALQGKAWAAAVVAPGLGLVLLFAMFLVAFSVAYFVGSLFEAVVGQRRAATSPFATADFPPPSQADHRPTEAVISELIEFEQPSSELITPEIVTEAFQPDGDKQEEGPA